jgi:aminoglycoside 6'-N-acetyltransferase
MHDERAGAGNLTWRPLTAADLAMLAGWLAEPGVARWWNHESSPAAVERDFGPSVRGEEPGAVEIDYLIADPGLRGRGLGTRLITMAVARTWADHPAASAVLVAVVAGNVASWRALEKAGLERVAEGDLTPDNPVDPPLHYVYRADRPSG